MLFAATAPIAQHAVVHNDTALDLLHKTNPFYNRRTLTVEEIDSIIFGVDAKPATSGDMPDTSNCPRPMDVHLAWTSKLGASVYTTPLLTDEMLLSCHRG